MHEQDGDFVDMVRSKEEIRSGAAATKKRGRKQAAKRKHEEPRTGDLFS